MPAAGEEGTRKSHNVGQMLETRWGFSDGGTPRSVSALCLTLTLVTFSFGTPSKLKKPGMSVGGVGRSGDSSQPLYVGGVGSGRRRSA